MKQLKRIFFLLTALAAFLSCSSGKEEIDYSEGISTMEDLAGKSVAVISGSVQDLRLSDLEPVPDIKRLSSSAEVMVAVETGKADYGLEDSTSMIGAHIEDRGLREVFSTMDCGGYYGCGFNYDNKPLQEEFNSFLLEFRSTGRLDSLKNKWTAGDVESVVMPQIPSNPEGEDLRVGLFLMFPFSFIQEGKPAGLEIEMLEIFALETGKNIKFDLIDFSGLIAALATKKVDMIAGSITMTEERSKKVLFSDPYYKCLNMCICRSSGFSGEKKSFLMKIKESFVNNIIVENRWKLILDGFYETLIISILSIIFGSLFGVLVCCMRMSRRRFLRNTAVVYVDIIRGVPILVLLMLMFYVVFTSGHISPRWVAIIAFAMNFGAYVSEMYRTGIEGVDRGQSEAGLAMGFSPFKTFILFIVPQAAKKIIPVFKGEAVSLIKNTSVVGFIAIQDLTKASEIIRSRTFDAFFPLIIISIIYFILAWILGKLLDSLAKKIA